MDDDLILNLYSYNSASPRIEIDKTRSNSSARHDSFRKGRNERKKTKKRNVKTRQKNLDSSFCDEKASIGALDKDQQVSKVTTPKDVISSLFTYNPNIPEVELEQRSQNHTTLFTNDQGGEIQFGLDVNFVKNLRESFNVERFTLIQLLSIPTVLSGKDCLIKSPTGSGKTLAYAIPTVHILQRLRPKIRRSDGPYAIVVLPTRELALQSYEVLETLCRTYVWIVPGVLVGGEKKKAEKARLRKGINILIATPGRLLDHMNTTKCLSLAHIRLLIFDEADRILDLGFEKDILAILGHVSGVKKDKKIQTLLLSATLNSRVESLGKLSLDNPKIVLPQSSDQTFQDSLESLDTQLEAPASLRQDILFVPAKMRFIALVAFLKEKLKGGQHKVMVFVSSKASVSFHVRVLDTWASNYGLNWNIYGLHGDMPQPERTANLSNFKKKLSSILFCTNVAARGLDLPYVSCIVQYTCSGNIEEYVHRSGRTARMGSKGQSLLFLLPSEAAYVDLLVQHKLSLTEVKLSNILSGICPAKKKSDEGVQAEATKVQLEVEELVQKDQNLKKLAATAYQSYIQAYSTYPAMLKSIFTVKQLHLGHIAKSFALREVPGKIANFCCGKSMLKHKKGLSVKRKANQDNSEYFGMSLVGPKPGKRKKRGKM